jgi:hypothetical protein
MVSYTAGLPSDEIALYNDIVLHAFSYMHIGLSVLARAMQPVVDEFQEAFT